MLKQLEHTTPLASLSRQSTWLQTPHLLSAHWLCLLFLSFAIVASTIFRTSFLVFPYPVLLQANGLHSPDHGLVRPLTKHFRVIRLLDLRWRPPFCLSTAASLSPYFGSPDIYAHICACPCNFYGGLLMRVWSRIGTGRKLMDYATPPVI